METNMEAMNTITTTTMTTMTTTTTPIASPIKWWGSEDDDHTDDALYSLPVDFAQKVNDLYGDELYRFFLTFSVEQLDYVAKNHTYGLEKMYDLWRAILELVEIDLDEALNNLEICIEDDIAPGISAWGADYDYLFEKKKEYEAIMAHYK
jgi:hypothetical protein